MKAKLEEKGIENRGVILESENSEEKKVLQAIWAKRGQPVMIKTLPDGNIFLVIDSGNV